MFSPGPLRERSPFSNHYLHYPAINTLILCPRLQPSGCPIQDCAAGVRCSIGWSLRVAGLSYDIPMLAHCICLEQGHCGRALHQCTRNVDCSRHFHFGLGYICRRTPTAYDLESPDNKSREDCGQRRVPFGVIVRWISSLRQGALADG